MNGNGQSSPKSNLPPIILVLLLASGVFLLPSVIERDRPLPSGKGMHTEGVQNIDARLWQDPFGVIPKSNTKQYRLKIASESGENPVLDFTITTSTSDPSPTERRDLRWISNRITGRNGSVRVILSLVPGGTWVGADEIRRRTRYATLAGLEAQNYEPIDPEHIGYIEEKYNDGWLARLPFEWLSSERGDDYVLLLWVDEEALTQDIPGSNGETQVRPLSRLTCLIDIIQEYSWQKGADLSFIVLGPSSSTFLKAVCKESRLENLPGCIPTRRQPEVQWYSHSSTLPDSEFKIETGPGQFCDLTKVLPHFHSLIVSDGKLVEELAKELQQRRFGGGNVVALVGQWDTAYSRKLRSLMKSKIKSLCALNKEEKVIVISASYLRGVDGRVPGESEKAKEGDSKDQNTAEKIERPEGDHQVDYLRRLGAELKAKEDKLGRLSGIGILGDDYYDKLMTLKALRPIFPDSVFFTTDLEAGMLLPSDNKFTRNLVVASGYGLSLLPSLQKDIPPFRSVYQTSIFLAVQVAIENAKPNIRHLSGERIDSWLKPQLFEIGRTRAVPLTKAPLVARCEDLANCDYPHKSAPQTSVWYQWLIMPLTVILVWLLTWISGFTERSENTYWLISILFITLISSTMTNLFMIYPDGEEPFDFVEGISIWPSELVRLLALIFSVGLILRGRKHLKMAHSAIDQEYFSKTTGHEPDMRNTPKEGQEHLGLDKRDDPPQHPRQAPEALWRIYSGKPVDRENLPFLLRLPCWTFIILAIVTFTSTFMLLINILDINLPQTPARGQLGLWVDRALIMSVVIAFQALLWWAVYQSHRAAWLALQLRDCEKCERWQSNTLDSLQFTARTGSESKYPKTNRKSKVRFGSFDHWLNVNFIARVTEPVQSIIFYPFPILALLILARSSLFDRWHIPTSLLMIFLVFILIVLLQALRLRTVCEKVRRQTVQVLDTSIIEAYSKGDKEWAKYVETLLAQIRNLKMGAFAPFTQQPLVKAVLTVAGSISGVKLLEYANLANF